LNRADPSEKGLRLFSKIKGRTESRLLALSSSNPSLRVYNVRPGYVDPKQAAVPIDRPRGLGERTLMGAFKPLFAMMPGLTIPSDKLGEFLVRLALGDGEPLKDDQGIEAGGRTIRNAAVRRFMGFT
jgi:hypothetical protein